MTKVNCVQICVSTRRSVGSGFPACRRASARREPRCTRPGETVRRSNQSCLDWIVLNVPLDPLELFSVADQSVIALVLPEWSMFSQNAIRLVSSESFEGPQPVVGRHVRRHQQVHVIRHHHICMQLVTMKLTFAVPDGIDYDLRDFLLVQEQRTACGLVKQAVHRNKGLAGRDASRRKNAIFRETS